MRWTLWATAALVTLAASLAACGGSDSDEDADQDDTTNTTLDEESAVLDAYEASWQAFEEASQKPANPGHPALAETMTGPALEAAIASLRDMAESGEYLDGPSHEHTPRITEMSPERAIVEDCVVDRTTRHAIDGSVVGESSGSPAALEAVMVKENGAWKRSELSRGEQCPA